MVSPGRISIPLLYLNPNLVEAANMNFVYVVLVSALIAVMAAANKPDSSKKAGSPEKFTASTMTVAKHFDKIGRAADLKDPLYASLKVLSDQKIVKINPVGKDTVLEEGVGEHVSAKSIGKQEAVVKKTVARVMEGVNPPSSHIAVDEKQVDQKKYSVWTVSRGGYYGHRCSYQCYKGLGYCPRMCYRKICYYGTKYAYRIKYRVRIKVPCKVHRRVLLKVRTCRKYWTGYAWACHYYYHQYYRWVIGYVYKYEYKYQYRYVYRYRYVRGYKCVGHNFHGH